MTIDNLDFNRADFGTETAEDDCLWCTRGLNGSYFDVQGTRICSVCAEQVREIVPTGTRATFLRSIFFGSLAAAVTGFAYFMLFRMTSGAWMFFVSVGVGYVIAKAMRMGSSGVGGRRYQVIAALLTSVAVVMASSAAVIGHVELAVWAYPLLVFAPIISLFLNQAELGALQLLFVLAGARWAWILMAEVPFRMSGPHPTSL